jgi:hypothetical protein
VADYSPDPDTSISTSINENQEMMAALATIISALTLPRVYGRVVASVSAEENSPSA